MEHMVEHAQDPGDPEFQSLCMSVIYRIMKHCETHNEIPVWKQVMEHPIEDATVILKKDLHYEQVEFDEPLKDAPWIAITADPQAVPHLPRIFDDGGLLVAKGQVSLHNRHIHLQPQYDEEETQAMGNALLPKVEGDTPNTPPIFLSQLDNFPEPVQAFAAMPPITLPHIGRIGLSKVCYEMHRIWQFFLTFSDPGKFWAGGWLNSDLKVFGWL